MTIESVFLPRSRTPRDGLLTTDALQSGPFAPYAAEGFAAVDSILADLTFHHFAIVVADLDLARELHTVELGVEAWQSGELSGPALRHGRLVALDGTRIAVGRLGAGLVELIQPGPHPTVAREILDRRGEGLFAVGYLVSNPRAALRGAQAHGAVIEQVQPNRTEPTEAYLDAGSGLLIALLRHGATWPL
ncbi:VOC family protein [Frankia sp. AgB32]|uniref:VOC family protein n=1 Tax=Frankia sp. AgB32 TaxID=631119 RepID=UPI00200BDA54|nr:VOC family protein [Frankia sp. AgB32]MCK9894751.1 VOC family protein [Frankia sp. AgB32]